MLERVRSLIVLHGPFSCNSGIQVFHLAYGLTRLGWQVAVAAPSTTADVGDVGEPEFECLTHAQAVDAYRRPGGDALVVHAWTPREGVRRVVEEIVAATGAPYVVHLEDNEEHLASVYAKFWAQRLRSRQSRVHPARYAPFVAGAAALTMVTAALDEFNFAGRPHLVIPPVVDAEQFAPGDGGAARRAELGIDPNEFVLVYHGNLHAANRGDLRELYRAVQVLRGRGRPVRLVRLGSNDRYADRALRSLRDGVIELGVRPRAEVVEYLRMANAFVQPGASDSFNAYRFPSKVPEFLALERPVILPECNVGRELEDGVDALLLRTGTAAEIADRVDELIDDPVLAERRGRAGREFALRRLTASTVAPRASAFLESVATPLPSPALACA